MGFDWANVRCVEVTPPHLRTKPKANGTEPFATMRLSDAAAAMKVLKTPKAMVWIWIVHQTRKRQSSEVTVSKGALARYGVSKKVKKVALAQLAAARLIAVKRKPGKATVVKLMQRAR